MKNKQQIAAHHQRNKQRKQIERRKRKKELRRAEHKLQALNVVQQIYKTIQHFFPDLFTWLKDIEDFRNKSDYGMAELITACIAMFLFKAESRNEMNNLRNDEQFEDNYYKLFKMRLPHMDTVDRVMRDLPVDCLEQLKKRMIQTLLTKKVLHKYRFRGWFIVAVDGTRVASYDEQHCEHCLHSTSKNDVTHWFHNVLEAKIITPNGFSLSIASVWIENPEKYDKQDCETKAFIRLAEILKQEYPRLPLCITADGLYPNQRFFKICQDNGWHYILTFKDGNLPSVWEEVESLQPLQVKNQRTERIVQDDVTIERHYRWVTDIDYQGYTVHWLQCLETRTQESKGTKINRFVHLSDVKPDYFGAPEISATGRLRWKIENEGFNTQKNHGYNLTHKYSRKSYLAMKNYYQSLQIAHIINELAILSQAFQTMLTGKMTIKHLWYCFKSLMSFGILNEQTLTDLDNTPYQIRFIT